MATPEQMTAAVHGYVAAFDKGDPEAVVALFAPDATVEDPVGTDAKIGHAAIREFYTASMATGAKLQLEGPIRLATDYAAFAFRVELTNGSITWVATGTCRVGPAAPQGQPGGLGETLGLPHPQFLPRSRQSGRGGWGMRVNLPVRGAMHRHGVAVRR